MSDTKAPVKKQNWFERHRAISVVGTLVLVFGVLGALSGGDPQTSPESVTSTPPTTAAAEAATPAEPKQPDAPAEYLSAVAQATSYANTMNMSKQGVYDQLTSEYGGKFTAPAAQYAIDNVKADWNAIALASAKTYQNTMQMSPAAIRDQLVSAYGGKFTAAEADYAIAHLND